MQYTLSILALVLSLVFHGSAQSHAVDIELFGHDSYTSLPQLDANNAQSRGGKDSFKLNLFAQSNIDSTSPSNNFLQSSLHSYSYYLPIYGLIRKKEYFLLI